MKNETQKNTRIVSHDFSVTKWIPFLKEEFYSHSIYLYVMPEAVINKENNRSSFSHKYYKVP